MRKAMMVLTLLVLALLVVPAPVRACGNVVYTQTDLVVFEARNSAQLLDAGRFGEAAKAVLGAFPQLLATEAQIWLKPKVVLPAGPKGHWDRREPAPSPDAMNRARRILALATLRSHGMAMPKPWRSAFIRPDGPIRWAIATLTASSQAPAIRGEALAQTEEGTAEALSILGSLAHADTLGDAMAYAALAGLRKRSGDTAGSKLALTACRDLTPKPANCTAYLSRVPIVLAGR